MISGMNPQDKQLSFKQADDYQDPSDPSLK